jgi:hypothetical protein
MSWFRPSPAIPVRAIGPANPKMRVLYVLDHYPELSESYIHSEIRVLGEEYEIFVVALHRASVCPNPVFLQLRAEHFPDFTPQGACVEGLLQQAGLQDSHAALTHHIASVAGHVEGLDSWP